MSSTNVRPYRGSYLMPSLEHATVSDAMHPGIISCEPDASLTEVARLMATHHVHCIAVIGISHEGAPSGVWGLVSDLNLIRAGIRNGGEPTAGDLAHQPPIAVDPTAPLREACELMLDAAVSHVVVIERESERPIGILSTADIAGVLAWGEA